MTPTAATRTTAASKHEADVLLSASKVVSAAVAHSLAVAEEQQISLPALRVLVMLAASSPMNLTAVADGLGVNASTASRTCERLVRAGLIHRRDDDSDRRHVSLSLTSDGARFVSEVMAERRKILVRVLESMAGDARVDLIVGLEAFVEAASELRGQPGLDGAGGGVIGRFV